MKSDEQQIRDLVQLWMDATRNNDLETVLGLMTDDVVFLVAGHQPMIGKAAYALAARGQDGKPRPAFDGSSDIQEINIVGEWAYLWSRLTVVVSPPGGTPAIRRQGHTLTLFRREQGKWLLARDANMLTTVPS